MQFSKIYFLFFQRKQSIAFYVYMICMTLWHWLSWPMFWQEAMAFGLWMKHHLTKWNHPEYDEQKDHSCGKCQISNENFSKLQQIRIAISFKPVSSYTIFAFYHRQQIFWGGYISYFFPMDQCMTYLLVCLGVHSIDWLWVNYSDVRSHQPE